MRDVISAAFLHLSKVLLKKKSFILSVMQGSSKRSYGPKTKNRVRDFFEALLEIVIEQRELPIGCRLEFSWSNIDPLVEITTNLKTIVILRNQNVGKLDNSKTDLDYARTALIYLRDYLGILEDHRTKTRGSSTWQFSLKLWGKQIDQNLTEFDQLWESKRSPQSKPNPQKDIKEDQWIIFGAGRIGRGLINTIASELEYQSVLVVAGENTPRRLINSYNQNGKYTVRVFENINSDESSRDIEISNFQFCHLYHYDSLINSIANPRTKIVSTSVGLNNLDSIIKILSEGIYKKFLNDSQNKLLLLVFENGQNLSRKIASEILYEKMRQYLEACDLPSEQILETTVEIPNIVLDCYIPNIPDSENRIIVREQGMIWIEKTEYTTELFSHLACVNLYLANPDCIHSIHYLKHYGFNSVNLYYAVIGLLKRVDFINDITSDQILTEPLKEIRNSVSRILDEHIDFGAINIKDLLPNTLQDIQEYIEYVHHRLSSDGSSVWFRETEDNLDRIYPKIINKDYIRDQRVFGPLLDGLSQEDTHGYLSTHKVLIHVISVFIFLSMKVFESDQDIEDLIGERNKLYGVFDKDRSISTSDIECFVSNILNVDYIPGMTKETAIVNAISDDIRYLCERLDQVGTDSLPADEICVFLNRDIQSNEISIPTTPYRNSISVVIFDLDEGMINSEGVLFMITNSIIRSHRAKNVLVEGATSGLSIEDYAKCIGMSETEFFDQKIKKFISTENYSAADFIEERDRRYIAYMTDEGKYLYYKPGLMDLLNNLPSHIRLAVCSNASRERIDKTLEYIGCNQFFQPEAIKSGTDPDMEEKPSTVMIEYICNHYNVEPRNCLVIESTEYGVEAARQSGCFCLKIANDFTLPSAPARGVRIFHNFLQVRDALLDFFDDEYQYPSPRISLDA